jgi:16S rRNA (guanine527-N7)-methyltransferase
MLSTQLKEGLGELGIGYDQAQIDLWLSYVDLLLKWNKAYNLTAIKDASKMVDYHLLDSLAISESVPDTGQCLDVGTGAGLPGIPLAILRPQTQWVLLDSNGKKTRFVQQAVASCGLSNVKVVQARVQDYHAGSLFDLIVSRAYASLQDYVSSVHHLWQASTRLISMKTELGDTELQAMNEYPCDLEIKQLYVPGIVEKRSLVTLTRQKT